MLRLAVFLLAVCVLSPAQPLPSTEPLTAGGDLAIQMVEGFSRYLSRETAAGIRNRKPSRERLCEITGAVDTRLSFESPELVSSLQQPAQLGEGPGYTVLAVRWPVLPGVTAEGLLLQPKAPPAARVVALPDADKEPEDLAQAFRLAASGCQVLIPSLINRQDTWSGNPRIRMTNQPHREYIYRMSFPVGRHIIGYEVQKVLAAVDWFQKQGSQPVAVYGYGEGGLVAFYAAAIDERIQTAVVSGYFQPREDLWREPIYRNVWSLLKDFGDAEIAKLIAPRKLIVEPRPGPTVTGPPEATGQRRGAAPGILAPVPLESIRKEAERARHLGANIEVAEDGIENLLAAARIKAARSSSPKLTIKLDRAARQRRQFEELVEYSQRMVRDSERIRYEKLAGLDLKTPQGWTQSSKPLRDQVWNEMIGRLPAPTIPPNIRTRRSLSGVKWDGFEVMYDLFPDVHVYGVLLLPKDLKPGERRPVVVVQHGLEGRAQDMFGQPEVEQTGGKATTFFYYRNIGSRLADQGFIVYSPQNPYIGENLFRQMQRQAHPLRLSLFSLILAQNERLLDWLTSLPYVDPARIGFYGLSYGGKTALRVPPLLDRYALSICSGDFNEWIVKLTTVDAKNTYIFTQEYEMWEWDQAHIANHAELAMLMAPRPFMVERGHRDGVGEDEWVSYEYAKVRRFYDEMGIGDRTTIEYFNGPHRINGVGTVGFLKKFLMRPANLLGVAERD